MVPRGLEPPERLVRGRLEPLSATPYSLVQHASLTQQQRETKSIAVKKPSHDHRESLQVTMTTAMAMVMTTPPMVVSSTMRALVMIVTRTLAPPPSPDPANPVTLKSKPSSSAAMKMRLSRLSVDAPRRGSYLSAVMRIAQEEARWFQKQAGQRALVSTFHMMALFDNLTLKGSQAIDQSPRGHILVLR